MNLQRILARVRLLTGDGREALLMTLCMDAMRMLEGKLRCPAETADAYADALCAAAAAEVLYQLALLDAAQTPDSLTAGNLRAEYKSACDRAAAYRAQCLRAVAPVLQDDGFFFGGVRA